MDLNLFENLKKDIESNGAIKKFMDELTDFLNKMNSVQTQKQNSDIGNEKQTETKEFLEETTLDEKVTTHRKEGHLYFVTEDRDNEIYLWDFTDKPKHEFKETITSEELLCVAKEGAMLQYKDGKYQLYSQDGYDMLFDEENEKRGVIDNGK